MPEIPESVTVSGEAIVDIAARIYSLTSRLYLFSGGGESGLGDEIDSIGSELLWVAFPDPERPEHIDSGVSDLANSREEILTAEWVNKLAAVEVGK